MILKLIRILEEATNLKAYPLFTDSIKDCLVYKANVISDNGAVARHRLELRLITHTVSEAERLKPIIIDALVNIGDNMKIEGIYEGNMNGGGTLWDEGTQTIHSLLYYEFITRSSVND